MIEVVKLREISSTEVTYHKFDYLDGPIFKVEKEKLEKIRYATGLIEYLITTDAKKEGLIEKKSPLILPMLVRKIATEMFL